MPIAVLGNQGILLPADTTANRPTSGNEFSNGVLRYNTRLIKLRDMLIVHGHLYSLKMMFLLV